MKESAGGQELQEPVGIEHWKVSMEISVKEIEEATFAALMGRGLGGLKMKERYRTTTSLH